MKDIEILSTDEIGYIRQEHSRTFFSREGVRKYLLVLQMFMEGKRIKEQNKGI